jgi:hypothetical protein
VSLPRRQHLPFPARVVDEHGGLGDPLTLGGLKRSRQKAMACEAHRHALRSPLNVRQYRLAFRAGSMQSVRASRRDPWMRCWSCRRALNQGLARLVAVDGEGIEIVLAT